MNKIIKIIVVCLAALTLAAAFPAAASAAVPIDPLLYPQGAPTVSGDAPTTLQQQQAEYETENARILLMQRITNVILGIAGVIAVFFIMNNAWFLIISAGKEETVTQHKKGLMWAIVGLILIILSYSIVRFIISLTFQANEPPAAVQTEERDEDGYVIDREEPQR